jgi:hypothetical protein
MKDEMKVILVYSTSHAIRIEKTLKKGSIPCKLVPVPRHLSSDCGICVRFRAADEDYVTQAVAGTGIETAGIFAL